MRVLVLCLLLVSGFSFAFEPIEFHAHEIHMSGVLPEPYNTLEFTIKLNEENDNVEEFIIYRGSERLYIPTDIIADLKDIELGTLEVSHEMHRADGEYGSRFGDDGDWLHFTFEYGVHHRADKVRDGVPVFKWGKNKITVTITKGKDVTISRRLLKDSFGNWQEKTW